MQRVMKEIEIEACQNNQQLSLTRGAEPNRQKNKSPLISMEIVDTAESGFVKKFIHVLCIIYTYQL